MAFGKIKKTKIAFFIILFLILISMGIFLWKTYKTPNVGLVRFEEFKIEETDGGKIIRHEEFGLKLTIPKDWEIMDGKDILYVNTPDFQLDPVAGPYSPPIPQKGCVIGIEIKKEIENSTQDILYTLTKKRIEACLESLEGYNCGYQIIQIDNNNALKHISYIEDESLLGNYIRIQAPKNEKIYIFETYLFGEDKEKCVGEFDKILKTVEINS